MKQFVSHVLTYSDMLFGWQLFHKRVELLKSVAEEMRKTVPLHTALGRSESQFGRSNILLHPSEHHIASLSSGISFVCKQCQVAMSSGETVCSTCTTTSRLPQCFICRLHVKGTSLLSLLAQII